MRTDMTDSVDTAAKRVHASKKIVVFTGAGISTESGIPDFRSPGGLWSKYDPEDFTFQRFTASESARKKYWQMSTEFYTLLKSVQPNAAHRAIADLEALKKLDAVITQNIDGMHQLAGVSPERVIEIHGTTRRVTCLDCHQEHKRDEIQDRIDGGESVPRCSVCNGLLKPATISFGQAMPERETAEAFERSKRCDLMMVIGSSLLVQPAASIPLAAKQEGADLIIINREATPMDHLADVVLRDSAGAVLTAVLEKVRRLSDQRTA
jgi:NAD-dependent deacetylase